MLLILLLATDRKQIWDANVGGSNPSEVRGELVACDELPRDPRRRAGLPRADLSISVGCRDAQISWLGQTPRIPDIGNDQAQFLPPLKLLRRVELTP